MGNVNTVVLNRLRAVCGEPVTPDPEAFMDEYERALSPFDDRVLERAVDTVLDREEYRTWPMPGAIRNACEKFFEPVPTLDNSPIYKPSEDSPVVKARIDRMVKDCLAKIKAKAPAPVRAALPDVSRPAMKARGLTELSRRMSGDT